MSRHKLYVDPKKCYFKKATTDDPFCYLFIYLKKNKKRGKMLCCCCIGWRHNGAFNLLAIPTESRRVVAENDVQTTNGERHSEQKISCGRRFQTHFRNWTGPSFDSEFSRNLRHMLLKKIPSCVKVEKRKTNQTRIEGDNEQRKSCSFADRTRNAKKSFLGWRWIANQLFY